MGARTVLHKVLPEQIKHHIRRQWVWLAIRALSYGPLTTHLINRYCCGLGVEIGPGNRPYGPSNTLLLDRFLIFNESQNAALDALADANALPVATGSLDYLISSHCLEHQPDTLTTLDEWRRALRPDGIVFLVLPHADRTFDRGRPLHELGHHEAEHGQTFDPDADDAHFDSWESALERTWRESHPWAPDARRADGTWDRKWMVDRALVHYHAWTQHEMVEIMSRTGWRIMSVIEEMPDRPDSFVIVAGR